MQLSRPVVGRGALACAMAAGLSAGPASAQGPVLPDLPVSRLEQLADGPRQPVTQPVVRPSGSTELDGPHLLSVTFPRPVPVRNVLALLVRGTPFSAVVDATVRGTFTGELRNLTIRQALEAVLFPSALDYDLRRTVIRVYPRRPRTRLYPLDLLAVRRSWQSRPAAAGAIVSAVESDVFGEIDRGVSALLSTQGRHHVDRRAGLVQVTDFADRLDQVGLYLEAVQLRATRQIRIDVRILRVTPAAPATGGGAPSPAIVADPRALIESLGRSGEVEIVASPTLVTMNNEPAMVSVGADAAPAVENPAHPHRISLVVTPQVSADGFVQLSVVPAIATGAGHDGAAAPAGASSESDTVVRVRLGDSVLMSALPQGHVRRGEWLVLLTPSLLSPAGTPPGPRGPSQAGQQR